MTAPSAPSSASAAPPSTPNVHGHPSTSRPAASPGRSSEYAGIRGPLASRYIWTIYHSRTKSRLTSTILASGAGSSFFRLTPTHWSTAEVRPTATPTSLHAYQKQQPTPTEPDATASLAPTLLASTSCAPKASHRKSRLHHVWAWVGSCPPNQDPLQPSSLLPSPPTTMATSSYRDHAWSTMAPQKHSLGLFQIATPPPGPSSAPRTPPGTPALLLARLPGHPSSPRCPSLAPRNHRFRV